MASVKTRPVSLVRDEVMADGVHPATGNLCSPSDVPRPGRGAITAQDVVLYAQARGYAGPDAQRLARRELKAMTPALRTRVLRACLTQSGWDFHDPIEDEPHLKAVFKAAEQAAKAEAGPGGYMGYCHLFWDAQQRILQERYGIAWYTPRQMNPNVEMD